MVSLKYMVYALLCAAALLGGELEFWRMRASQRGEYYSFGRRLGLCALSRPSIYKVVCMLLDNQGAIVKRASDWAHALALCK